MRDSWGGRVVPVSAFILLWGALSREAGGQDLTSLVSACSGGSETLAAWCQEVALATQAAQGALALAASGGSEVPGSASTLGWRMKRSPRFAISAWGSLTSAPLPSLKVLDGLPGGKAKAILPSFNLSGTIGLLDGFALSPTVGGFGSLDLTASAHWIRAPTKKGFEGNVGGWGLGARLGLLRESFTLPGISVSATYRSIDDAGLWSIADRDPAQTRFELGSMSLRGLLGKDLFGIGVMAGIGWDRYSGDIRVTVADPGDGATTSSGAGEVRSGRRVFFLGASRTFLTLQVSGEAGWAAGFDPDLPVARERGFDPSGRSYFGRLALRLTF